MTTRDERGRWRKPRRKSEREPRSDDRLSVTSRLLLMMTGGVPVPYPPLNTLTKTTRRMLRLPPADESDE